MYPSDADPSFGCFVERSAQALRSQGVATEVVAMRRRGGRWQQALDFVRFVGTASRAIARGEHDCVYVHHPLHTLLACLPGLALRPARVVLNFHGHDLLPVTRRGRVLKWLLQRRFVGAQAVIVPSTGFQRRFDAEFGARGAPPAQVFPSGGVADLFHAEPVPGLAQRSGTALFLSRWTEGKGWPEFLQFAQRLCAHDPTARLTVAGTGPDASRIASAIAAAGLVQRVAQVTCTDAATARALYRSHRCFVMPSRFDESLALVNLEAMASGCVVLTADFPAAQDYVRHGVNGFRLGREGLAEAAFERVRDMQADLAAAQQIADAARRDAAPFAQSRVQSLLPGMMGLHRTECGA